MRTHWKVRPDQPFGDFIRQFADDSLAALRGRYVSQGRTFRADLIQAELDRRIREKAGITGK